MIRLPTSWERWRIATPPNTAGTAGTFVFPNSGEVFTVVLSDGPAWQSAGLTGEPWEHASIALAHRCPSWPEMEWMRRQLWSPEDTVMQLHPPIDQYVNANEYALHLWRPTVTPIPMPLSPTVATQMIANIPPRKEP